MKNTYSAMPGSGISSSTAIIVGKALDKIARKEGVITPESVVNIARPDTSPLHPFFTWEDAEAAELYRQDEARKLIRSVRIVRVDQPPQEQRVIRAFHNVSATDTETAFEGKGYLPIAWIQRSEDYRQQVLNRAKEELRQWANRYRDYKEQFTGILEDVMEEVA